MRTISCRTLDVSGTSEDASEMALVVERAFSHQPGGGGVMVGPVPHFPGDDARVTVRNR